MTCPVSVRRRAGFTLVELMVVIAILVILAGIGTGIAIYAYNKGLESETATMITRLEGAMTGYMQIFGAPPTELIDVGGAGNGVNEGIETLVLCLTSRSVTPHEFQEDELINTDKDKQSGNPTDSILGGGALWEVADSWGQPIIYCDSDDYGVPYSYNLGAKTIAFTARKSEKLGTFHNPQSCQLISVGADGEPGTDDDITNYAKK